MENLFGPSEGRRGPDTNVSFAICSFQSEILQLVCVVDFAVFSSNMSRLTFISFEEKISVGALEFALTSVLSKIHESFAVK